MDYTIHNFIVFISNNGELEQLSVPFKTFEEAIKYKNGVNENIHPYTYIMATLL